MLLRLEQQLTNWIHEHMESLAILTGGITGALWKANLVKVAHDLWTLHHIEGAIIVGCKALIGAAVAWTFKRICNYFTRKKINHKNARK